MPRPIELSTETYPNGRVLDYVYNSGLDSDISRISGLSDAAGTGAGSVESYLYLGRTPPTTT